MTPATLKCPKCKRPMEYLGNVSRLMYSTNPPLWDGVYICRVDRLKTTIREGMAVDVAKPPPDLDEYRAVVVE